MIKYNNHQKAYISMYGKKSNIKKYNGHTQHMKKPAVRGSLSGMIDTVIENV